jgi:hypothetical protein
LGFLLKYKLAPSEYLLEQEFVLRCYEAAERSGFLNAAEPEYANDPNRWRHFRNLVSEMRKYGRA